jgi:hypothetical protein
MAALVVVAHCRKDRLNLLGVNGGYTLKGALQPDGPALLIGRATLRFQNDLLCGRSKGRAILCMGEERKLHVQGKSTDETKYEEDFRK